jgi:hypothetical protein
LGSLIINYLWDQDGVRASLLVCALNDDLNTAPKHFAEDFLHIILYFTSYYSFLWSAELES